LRRNLAECSCGKFVRYSIAYIYAVKVVAAAEYHVRVGLQVCAEQAVCGAVLEDGRRGKRGNSVGVGAVFGAVGPGGQ
jgi:hypothetical protein